MPKPSSASDPKNGDEITRKPDDSEPFAALAFKIATDPYGNLTYFRVYSGTLEKGSYVYNARSGRKERIGRILRMHANHREDIDSIGAGDIAAAVGLSDTRTGDTLCDEKHADHARIDHVPRTGHLAGDRTEVEGRSRSARQGPHAPRARGSDVPHADRRRDAANDHRRHGRTASRDHSRSSCAASSKSKPTSANRRSRTKKRSPRPLRSRANSSGSPAVRVNTATSGCGSNRSSPASGFDFEWKIVGGAVPKEYAKAVQQGIEESSQSGVLAGFPVLDFKVTAFDGSYHDVDSSEMAFKIAASMGWKEANRAAGPILLEPIMKVEVTTPKDYMGAITGDLNRRRGMIQATEEAPGGAQVITAQRPALGNVRVRDRHAFSDARPRDVHDGVLLTTRRLRSRSTEEIIAKSAGKKSA